VSLPPERKYRLPARFRRRVDPLLFADTCGSAVDYILESQSVPDVLLPRGYIEFGPNDIRGFKINDTPLSSRRHFWTCVRRRGVPLGDDALVGARGVSPFVPRLVSPGTMGRGRLRRPYRRTACARSRRDVRAYGSGRLRGPRVPAGRCRRCRSGRFKVWRGRDEGAGSDSCYRNRRMASGSYER